MLEKTVDKTHSDRKHGFVLGSSKSRNSVFIKGGIITCGKFFTVCKLCIGKIVCPELVFRWCSHFHDGRISLNNHPRLEQAHRAITDIVAVDANRSVFTIADFLHLIVGTVDTIIHKHFDY